MIINKRSDILDQAEPSDIRKFSKPAEEIQEIKIEWKKKIKLYQKETYSEKEKANLPEEPIKYDLLETLKNEKIPMPFTTEKEIRDYLELEQDEKNRNSRLYNEI